MVIKNLKSNPYFHFVEVEGSHSEIHACNNWCTEQFGHSHSHSWTSDCLYVEPITQGILDKIRARINGEEPVYHVRFGFPNPAHRDWFILRWS